MNYTTKQGYRVALHQSNQVMKVDAELTAEGYDSKARAKFFNRIWHPYLPWKVAAMQWLILAEGLPWEHGENAVDFLASAISAPHKPKRHCNMLSRIAQR